MIRRPILCAATVGLLVLLVAFSGCSSETNNAGGQPTTQGTPSASLAATTLPVPPTSATPTPVAVSYKTYQDSTNGITLQYPANWTSTASGAATILKSPATSSTDAYQESVSIVAEATTMSAQGYSDAKIEAAKQSTTNYNPMQDSKVNLKIGNEDARKVVYTGVQGTTMVRYTQLYVIKGSNAYVITFTTEEKNDRFWVTTREKIFDSIDLA
ncbi:MAG: hypothetical protein EHJ95_04380, partial [Methanobacteriota archaeon]